MLNCLHLLKRFHSESGRVFNIKVVALLVYFPKRLQSCQSDNYIQSYMPETNTCATVSAHLCKCTFLVHFSSLFVVLRNSCSLLRFLTSRHIPKHTKYAKRHKTQQITQIRHTIAKVHKHIKTTISY